MAPLQNHWKVIDQVGHSVQYAVLRLTLHFGVAFYVCCLKCWVIASHYANIGWSKLPYSNYFVKSLACGLWLPPATNISPKGKTGLGFNTMWDNREYIAGHIGDIGEGWVCLLLLAPMVRTVQYAKWTANLRCVAVVIIARWNNFNPILWHFTLQIQIQPGSGQSTCCSITLYWCCSSHIGRG